MYLSVIVYIAQIIIVIIITIVRRKAYESSFISEKLISTINLETQ